MVIPKNTLSTSVYRNSVRKIWNRLLTRTVILGIYTTFYLRLWFDWLLKIKQKAIHSFVFQVYFFFRVYKIWLSIKKRKISDWQYLHSTLKITWLFTKNQQTLCFLSERFFFSWFIWINVTITSGVSPYDNCFHWFKSKCSWFVSWLAL